MKNLSMKLCFISAMFIIFGLNVYAQNLSDVLTYKELLAQQKIERQELKDVQREMFDKILIRQKEETEVPHFIDDKIIRIKENQVERKALFQILTAEREKQTQLQTVERKEFLDRIKKPNL